MDEEVKKIMQSQQAPSRFFMPDEFYEQREAMNNKETPKEDIVISPVARTVPSFLEPVTDTNRVIDTPNIVENSSVDSPQITLEVPVFTSQATNTFKEENSQEQSYTNNDNFTGSNVEAFFPKEEVNNIPPVTIDLISSDSENNLDIKTEENRNPYVFNNKEENSLASTSYYKSGETEEVVPERKLSALEQFLVSQENAPLFPNEALPSQENNLPINENSKVENLSGVEDAIFEQHYREQVTEGILTNPFITPVDEEKKDTFYKALPAVDIIKESYTEDGLFIQPEDVKEDSVDSETSKKSSSAIQSWINKILRIPSLEPVKVDLDHSMKDESTPLMTMKEAGVIERGSEIITENVIPMEIEEVEKYKAIKVDYDKDLTGVSIVKSDLVERLQKKCELDGSISILARYGEDLCAKDYVTNPAIGRSEEIRQLILILLTPEKSGILIGKPGIGKTSIVEGLSYQLQRGNVPDALKGYTIVNVKTASLMGSLPTGETRLQTLVDELKSLDKIILFIDEIHMLIGATNDSALDFANMFKEGLGRGKIKVIGATTTEEYERYILRDKAFVRRFQKVEVLEPNRELTIRILMGTLPKLEKETGAKLKYTAFQQSQMFGFIVDITSEYKRIYGIGSRYPDICLTLLAQAFSNAVFENRKEVTVFDVRNAIENSKNIYPDVIRKELPGFDILCKDMIDFENGKGEYSKDNI